MSRPAYPHTLIAREGWPFIFGFLVIAIIFSFCHSILAIIFWLLTIFSVQFFRDPVRETTSDNPLDILSPADGRIVVVEKANDPFRQTEALKISIFMNVFNVHSNRSPVDGIVEKKEYFEGSFVNASLDKASTNNERCALLIQTNQGFAVTCVQIAGLVARRILCYANQGSQLLRGERYGLIRFGSRVDLYLPPNSVACVSIGDKVKATTTILARLPENTTQPAKEPVDNSSITPAQLIEEQPKTTQVEQETDTKQPNPQPDQTEGATNNTEAINPKPVSNQVEKPTQEQNTAQTEHEETTSSPEEVAKEQTKPKQAKPQRSKKTAKNNNETQDQ